MPSKEPLNISIVGLGYVGLPLAVAASKSGFHVTGIDINEDTVSKLNNGISTTEDITNTDLSNLINSNILLVSSDYSLIAESKIILICVPTPLTQNHKPDLSFVKMAVKSIAKYLSKGSLVILESTVEPGTTRNILGELLEEGSEFKRNDFQVAFSPERIDPSNKKWG